MTVHGLTLGIVRCKHTAMLRQNHAGSARNLSAFPRYVTKQRRSDAVGCEPSFPYVTMGPFKFNVPSEPPPSKRKEIQNKARSLKHPLIRQLNAPQVKEEDEKQTQVASE